VILPGLNIYETTDRFLFRDALRTAELAYCDGGLDPFQLSAVDEFLTIAISSEFAKKVLGLWERTRDKVDLSLQQRTSAAVRRIVVDRIPRGYHL
jgi:hypothetical protein